MMNYLRRESGEVEEEEGKGRREKGLERDDGEN